MAASLTLFALITPPLQNPDEILHLTLIVREMTPVELLPDRERELFALLERFDWYQSLGIASPDPLPPRLEDIPAFRGPYEEVWARHRTIYHRGMATLLGPLRSLPLLPLFFLLRGLSVLCTLLFFWLGTRLFFGTAPPPEWIPALAFPQVVMAGTAVNYDVLALLFGGLFFAGFAQLEQSRPRLAWLLLISGGLGSLLSKRSGLLFPLFLILGFVQFTRGRGHHVKLPWKWIGCGLAAAAIVVMRVFPERIFPLTNYLAVVAENSDRWIPPLPFLALLGESFVAAPRWLFYPLPFWLYPPYLGGLCWLLFQAWRQRSRPHPLLARMALPALALLTLAAYFFHGRWGIPAQGRYLMALLPLLAVALVHLLSDERHHPSQALRGLAVLNVTFHAYLLLSFLPTVFHFLRLAPKSWL